MVRLDTAWPGLQLIPADRQAMLAEARDDIGKCRA
jgi:hypothetical protein